MAPLIEAVKALYTRQEAQERAIASLRKQANVGSAVKDQEVLRLKARVDKAEQENARLKARLDKLEKLSNAK